MAGKRKGTSLFFFFFISFASRDNKGRNCLIHLWLLLLLLSSARNRMKNREWNQHWMEDVYWENRSWLVEWTFQWGRDVIYERLCAGALLLTAEDIAAQWRDHRLLEYAKSIHLLLHALRQTPSMANLTAVCPGLSPKWVFIIFSLIIKFK